jgi:hypothetical protein
MSKSSERIEEEIDGIRDRMRNRIDSAAREFSPRALASRVTGKEDPSTSELLDWAVTKARTNPIATALVTAGLIGFATQSTERTRLVSGNDVKRGSRKLRSYASDAADSARGYAHDAADIAVEKADDAAHYVREQADRAGRAVSRSAHDAEEAARYAADRSLEYGREGVDWVKHNPTATGLLALAVGAAAASVFAARRSSDPVLHSLGYDEPDETPPARRKAKPAKRSAAKTTSRAAASKSAAAKSTAKPASAKKAATPRKRKAATTGAQATAAKARATRATKPASTAPAAPRAESTAAGTAPSTPSTSTSTSIDRDTAVH